MTHQTKSGEYFTVENVSYEQVKQEDVILVKGEPQRILKIEQTDGFTKCTITHQNFFSFTDPISKYFCGPHTMIDRVIPLTYYFNLLSIDGSTCHLKNKTCEKILPLPKTDLGLILKQQFNLGHKIKVKVSSHLSTQFDITNFFII